MVKQHTLTAILTYIILFFSICTIVIGIYSILLNTDMQFIDQIKGFAVVLLVSLAKTILVLLLSFSFYYHEKKQKHLLVALCSLLLLFPITVYTANNSNFFHALNWFNDNTVIIFVIISLATMITLVQQIHFSLNSNLIRVSVLDGIETKEFFIKIYIPATKINIVNILLTQFIYGYIKF